MASLTCGIPTRELVGLATELSGAQLPYTKNQYMRIGTLLTQLRDCGNRKHVTTVAGHLVGLWGNGFVDDYRSVHHISSEELDALVSGTEKPKRENLVVLTGWCKTLRLGGGGRFAFLILNDGSCKADLQIIIHQGVDDFEAISKSTAGTSIKVVGSLVRRHKVREFKPTREGYETLEEISEKFEVHVAAIRGHSVKVVGKNCDPGNYVISKSVVSPEVLREAAHLRSRTYFISAVMRVRSALALATHLFFQKEGFIYLHTPIITTADCEGGGELFQVTTLFDDQENIGEVAKAITKQLESGNNTSKELAIDYKKDFFKRRAYLTCSGQLSAETYTCGMGKVYTFAPTFRAEKSHTNRHLAEFWMIEPEMDHVDLVGNMEVAEAYIKFCLEYVLEHCLDDLLYFDKLTESGLVEKLEDIVKQQFVRISYTDVITILEQHEANVKDGLVTLPEGTTRITAFEHPVSWGMDLQSEHERFIAEVVFKRPTIIYNYPAAIKAFYMRRNADGKTCAAMDVIVPRFGELVGGSQREERLDILEESIRANGLSREDYWWYLDLRRFGTIPHSGFGLGFERLVMLATGVSNIRDVIAFPRYTGNAQF
ncbi:bifunctional Class II Aminoacyl-tRNA synthetase-Biotinyl protein ligase (BPL) and lipoyl protein ligase (LPL)/Aminoacyl-tRNA synthetase [Babesia duncani]|uniref:asparagine--tRNA ligase n=1 Tax=Babesia duncani TaxID=323732 RepID=A0AAD9PI26_9APIC|nr:bifunctional Class II Aminoacyl-tRNA synthetase-Biotinyl protein ligase (BPL) and lipoyl protein ligase (LPL)/Aminoacyl-tRNA synthetase [Babesia duncani]